MGKYYLGKIMLKNLLVSPIIVKWKICRIASLIFIEKEINKEIWVDKMNKISVLFAEKISLLVLLMII